MKLRRRGVCLGAAQRELECKQRRCGSFRRPISLVVDGIEKRHEHVAEQVHVGICKKDCCVYARFISRWKYRFSSDQRSQAPLSSVSTGVGDQPGTLSDLAFLPPEVRGTRNSLVELAVCRWNIVRRNGNYLKRLKCCILLFFQFFRISTPDCKFATNK